MFRGDDAFKALSNCAKTPMINNINDLFGVPITFIPGGKS